MKERGVTAECSVDIGASCAAVFDVVHDYGIRLNWDTLLSEARIVDATATKAEVGVRTLCVGRASLARLGMETMYVSFDRPHVAAVRMVRGPWFLAEFAASIRHKEQARDTSDLRASSRVTYKLRIQARPRWLRFLLHPLLRAAFQWETRRRLASLKRYMESRERA